MNTDRNNDGNGSTSELLAVISKNTSIITESYQRWQKGVIGLMARTIGIATSTTLPPSVEEGSCTAPEDLIKQIQLIVEKDCVAKPRVGN
jgi:hypothetical protein